MKKSLLILCITIVFSSNYLLSQNSPYQDVRRVIVTTQYEIKDGKPTTNNKTIIQEIKDSLNRTHTVINRDYSSQKITSHTLHNFRGKQIVRTEEFVNGLLRHIKNFTYTSDSLIDTETDYIVNPGDTAFYVKLKYKYKNKKPVQIDAVDIKGKKAYASKLVYDNKGIEIKRTVKTKKTYAPLDSIVDRSVSVQYDSIARATSETIKIKYLGGKTETKKFNYGYNKKGLLSSIEEFDINGNLLYKKVLEYNERQILKFISVYNANNVLVEYYAKRYELYPTRDRRNQIIEY